MSVRKRLLIVDDNKNNSKTLELIFDSKGYYVESAESGRQAISKVENGNFDLALLDIRLPDMDGIELLHSLKKIQPNLACVMVTAYASIETAVQALNRGASGYIIKPVNIDEVSAKIEETLEKQRLVAENRNLMGSLQQELSERKRAQKVLRDNEERFRLISEQSHLGIVILQDGSVEYANEAFSLICGCPLKQILEWKLNDFEQRIQSDALEVEGCGEVSHFHGRVTTTGGEIKWVEIYSRFITYNSGRATMLTLIDVSEKKKAEEEAELQHQQLMQADKLASLGVLVAGVAHEINNPNYTIMSISNLVIEAWNGIVPVLEEYYKENGHFVMGGLSYEEMHEKMPQFLKEIVEASKRIDNIVSDLKNFSRQEVYDLNSEVDINRVVMSAVALSNGFLKKLTRQFEVRYGRSIPRIRGNFQRLEQVVINLIQNACQALEDREKAVCVMTEYNRDDQTVTIAIHDEGRGIHSENLSKVKDPFFTTRRASGGTGLGLAMSSRIVQDHHGSLSLTSEYGKGTAVTITLPVNNALNKEEWE